MKPDCWSNHPSLDITGWVRMQDVAKEKGGGTRDAAA
eukprot:COSAG02_NODE_44273_length_367_cov_1.656716_1_plen_36_part_10